MIASLIHVLLLPLVAAEARSHDEGGRCMAVHQRLAQLRAEIADVEREAKVACSPGVTPAAPPLPLPLPAALPPSLTPHLNTAAAARARQARPALPVGQSRPDVGVRMSGGRRRPLCRCKATTDTRLRRSRRGCRRLLANKAARGLLGLLLLRLRRGAGAAIAG